MVQAIPNPNGAKYMLLYDENGGAAFQMASTIDSNGNAIVDNLVPSGLGTTTSGVTGVGDNLFVSAAELADLITLQPLAALEAVLAAIGALTGAETLLHSAAGVDLNTDTPPTLYTVATGKSAVITRVVERLASVSLTTVSFSIGFNSTAFNNVIADATHTEIDGATKYTVIPAANGAVVGTTAQALKLKNNTKQGAAATATFDIFGYLF